MYAFHPFPESVGIDAHPVFKANIPSDYLNLPALSDVKINCIVDNVVHG